MTENHLQETNLKRFPGKKHLDTNKGSQLVLTIATCVQL